MASFIGYTSTYIGDHTVTDLGGGARRAVAPSHVISEKLRK